MSVIRLGTSVNEHFLARLMRLAESRPVHATEDIVDSDGVKVLSRGAQLRLLHQPELWGKTLRKPLESSLEMADAIDTGAIIASAAGMLDNCAPLNAIMRACGCERDTTLALLAGTQFSAPMRLLIELVADSSAGALEHCCAVSLLSVGVAKALGQTESDQRAAGLAGLLHDIGALYFDPAWLAPDRVLAPAGWVVLAAHSRLGQVLINELALFPLSVGRAVAEHHERLDGSGYPHQLDGQRCSAPGQAVGAAQMIAGFLHQNEPLARAELAFKIVPGEQPRQVLAALSAALRATPATPGSAPAAASCGESATQLSRRIGVAIEQCERLLDQPAPRIRALANRALLRLQTLQRALVSTGLNAYLQHQHGVEHALSFERSVATGEIQWRLRNIARDLALHGNASDEERRAFVGVIALLDQPKSSEALPVPAGYTCASYDAVVTAVKLHAARC